jgi:uncharacterized C2H2 Zn-finger protein
MADTHRDGKVVAGCVECGIHFKYARNCKHHMRKQHSNQPYTTKRKSAFREAANVISFQPSEPMFPADFLESIKTGVRDELEKQLESAREVKWCLTTKVQVVKPGTGETEQLYVKNKMEHIGWKGGLDNAINQQLSKTLTEMECIEIRGSGWSIDQILQVDLCICPFKRDESSSGIKMRGRKPSSKLHKRTRIRRRKPWWVL